MKTKKTKIGEWRQNKYTTSTGEWADGTKISFRNVSDVIMLHCDIETQLSHAYEKPVILKKTGEWNNQIFFDIFEK